MMRDLITPLRKRPPAETTQFSSSTSTSTISSILTSDAPTPNNTFSDPHAYESRPVSEEILYETDGDVSLNPSLVPSNPSRMDSTYSTTSSAYLLPHSPDPTNSLTPIPYSSRPVPIPPSTKLSPGELDLEVSTRKEGRDEDVDSQRLQQLGYDAVLDRHYTFWSSLCISWLNIGCLQGTIYAVGGAYSYGGPIMILVSWPLSGIFSLCLTLTMSELASAYPVSGAMASWAWKCARGGVGGERYWGWLMGGIVMGGHIGSALLVIWEMCNIIAGIMSLSFDYQKQAWHLVLFFLLILLICGVLGTTSWGRGHRFWLASGAYGLAIWVILTATLAVGARRHRGSLTTEFYNHTGWKSKPYVYLLGWEYCTIASGADASAHMAEETQNPSRNVPNAMTGSLVLSYVLGYISIVLLLLSIDPENAAVVAGHSFPIGYILEHAISRNGSIAVCCLLLGALQLQVLAQLQASSRFVFALARDNALPFSQIIRQTNSSKQPVVATVIVTALCAPFALLLVGSASTLYSVLAVTASTLSYLGYLIPVALYLFSDINLESEGRSSWSLRKWSKPFGAIGVIFALAVIIVQCFPGGNPVTIETMSWSPIVMAGTGVICAITWRCYGRRHYSGPIRALTKWQTGVELDLQSTLASRNSKPFGEDSELGNKRPPRETDSAFKLAITPYFSDLGPTVTVGSANTDQTMSDTGQWESEYTSGTGTGTESMDSGGTVTRNGNGGEVRDRGR